MKKHGCKNWSDKERAIIRKYAGVLSADEIAVYLQNRSPEATRKQANTMGLSLYRRGERHPRSKYTDAQIERACDLHIGGAMSLRAAAQAEGVNIHTLVAVIRGRLRRPQTDL